MRTLVTRARVSTVLMAVLGEAWCGVVRIPEEQGCSFLTKGKCSLSGEDRCHHLNQVA
jgi:hypothetical protein